MKLTQVELQNIKHLIEKNETTYQKMNFYLNQAQDAQVKQIFTKAAQDALNAKQKLIGFLNG